MKTAFERMKPELREKYNHLDMTTHDFRIATTILKEKYLFQITYSDALQIKMILDMNIDLNNFLDNFDI